MGTPKKGSPIEALYKERLKAYKFWILIAQTGAHQSSTASPLFLNLGTANAHVLDESYDSVHMLSAYE